METQLQQQAWKARVEIKSSRILRAKRIILKIIFIIRVVIYTRSLSLDTQDNLETETLMMELDWMMMMMKHAMVMMMMDAPRMLK